MKNNIYFIYLLLLAVLPVHSRNTSLFSVYEITCEQQIEPSGIGSKSPRFGWKVACQQRGYRQSAYRILVADTEDALTADKGTVWDSGTFLSSNSVLVPFQGKELHSATRYYWKVKVWNEAGRRIRMEQTRFVCDRHNEGTGLGKGSMDCFGKG